MKKQAKIFFVLLFTNIFFSKGLFCGSEYITFSQEPIAVAYAPNSILKSAPGEYIRFAGHKPRYSTCSGVSWYQNNKYIFAVNMHACSISIYKFDAQQNSLQPIETFTNSSGLQVARPENIAFSEKGDFFTVPNNASGKLNFYKTTKKNFFKSKPYKTIQDDRAHRVKFSKNNTFLAVASLSRGVNIYKVDKRDTTLIQNLGMPFFPLAPKTIDFSTNGKYMVIGYCVRLSGEAHQPKGLITVHRFDQKTGIIDPIVICSDNKQVSIETLAFHPDGNAFFAVDQVHDRVFGYAFHKETGQITDRWVAVGGEKAQLNVPHGISFSADGLYMAISNYGDDKITVYRAQNL